MELRRKTLRPIGALSATSRIRALSKYGYLRSYRVISREKYVEQAELRLLITRSNVFATLLGKSPDPLITPPNNAGGWLARMSTTAQFEP